MKTTLIIKSLQISAITLLVSAAAVWAAPSGPARIQGVVKDSNDKPVAGAEVHIQAKDGSGLQKIVRTDSAGNYGVSNLPVTDYEVILFVNGQIKASINNTKALANKPIQLNFKLTGRFAANQKSKHTHMVYVPAETGSNLGGRWVEVEDQTAGPTSTDNVEHVSGAAARYMQSSGRNNSGGN